MNHLEELIYEYYDWKGYIVKRNIKVGPLNTGGWEMELDIIAYNPDTNNKCIFHIEPSLDADNWAVRESRFEKKFNAGKKYMFINIFPWLEKSVPIKQIAVLETNPKNRDDLCGGAIISIDEMVKNIKDEISQVGIMANKAIPEQYPLLRTIQLSINGFKKSI